MLGDLLFQSVNNLAGQYVWLDAAGVFLAHYLPYVLVACLVLFLIWNFKKYWRIVLGGLVSAGLALGMAEAWRFFFYMPRPFVARDVNLLLSHLATGSFPSGHATFLFGLAIFLFFFNKKMGAIFLLITFLVGLARVFCGLHWVSDVFGGAIFGLAAALVIKEFFYRKTKQRA